VSPFDTLSSAQQNIVKFMSPQLEMLSKLTGMSFTLIGGAPPKVDAEADDFTCVVHVAISKFRNCDI
jgi:hypothetical protein